MAARADNNEGSCKQVNTGRHAGRWRVQYIVEDEYGRKKRLSRLFATQREGKDFLKSLKQDERRALAEVMGELTLEKWFDWLAENDWPETIAETTRANRIARFDKYVRKDWGGVSLTRLDPLAIRAFYRSLQERGVGQPTILELKRNLVRVFNQAMRPYNRVPWHSGNPFALHVAEPPPRDAVALTPDVAKKALLCPKLSIDRRAMLAVFLLGGLRISEQMALTAGQVLFDQNLILIDRSVKFDRTGRQSIGLPKGSKTRLVAMCPTLKTLLIAVTQGMSADQLIWSAAVENQPRMKKLVYMTWRSILLDAKLPSAMTPHDCRLTHINWIEKLMPLVSSTTLKEHVGHAAAGVTEVNYTRPLTPAQELLAKELERVAGLPSAAQIRVLARAS